MAIAGKVMPLPKGEYSSTSTYDVLDIVTYNNKLWISRVTNNIGNNPVETDTTYWMLCINGELSDIPNVAATSTDGIAYTATINNMTSLSAGKIIIIIPDIISASAEPTLNVNGLGAKKIKRRLSGLSSTVVNGYANTWLPANMPQLLQYDGTNWIVINQDQPMAVDLYGTVPIEKGGTGATTAEEARTALGIDTAISEAISAAIGEVLEGSY